MMGLMCGLLIRVEPNIAVGIRHSIPMIQLVFSLYYMLFFIVIAFHILYKRICYVIQAYWDWSWDELVAYDLPATFQYVHDQAGQKLHYVGHSLVSCIHSTTSFCSWIPLTYRKHFEIIFCREL